MSAPQPVIVEPAAGRSVVAMKEAARRLAAVREPGVRALTGVRGSGTAWLAVELLAAGVAGVVLVTPDVERAHRAMSDSRHWLQRDRCEDEPVLVLADDGDVYAPSHPDRRATLARPGALVRFLGGEARLLVTSAGSLVRKLPPGDALLAATGTIEVDTELDTSALRRTLSEAGYVQSPLVEDPGSFAVRGGILDVWPADARSPVRAELFGDSVSSLHEFDPESQRTERPVRRVRLPPARDIVLSETLRRRAEFELRTLCDQAGHPSLKTRQLVDDVTLGRQSIGIAAYLPAFYELVPLFSYLSPDVVILFEEPAACKGRLEEELERTGTQPSHVNGPHFPPSALYVGAEELEASLERHRVVSAASAVVLGTPGPGVLDRLDTSPEPPDDLNQDDHSELERAARAARAQTGRGAALDPLVAALAEWHEQGFAVECVVRSNTQAQRLATLLAHREVPLRLSPALRELEAELLPAPAQGAAEPWATVTVGPLERGVVAPLDQLVLLTEEEIFGHKAHTRPKQKRRARAPLEDLRALAPGDHVIHSEHGVGRYLGLENRTVPGAGRVELLVVEYLGGKLYLPVYRLNQIEKHAGDAPKLDRLGGTTFAKTKARAKAKAREMADDLLRLYAERNAVQKDPLAAPDDEYAAFEAAFPYEETADQAGAILDVQNDLSAPKVMDRLVCGDVGFGKTEVALRAAFRAVSAGLQVAVLCPTTVLAQQHFLTFQRRLLNHPFEVRALSRFENKKEVADTLKRIAAGTVDVVVGTHRLLSKDVQFKKLGLLVIDEEQRFGVVHKERLKKLRTQIDVLTLTATPIPRTLQLAMAGLREVSYIATPPADRRAIRTVVARVDDGIIKDAIERELSRGGQVYYVYNRVEGLAERATRIQALVPRARVAVGHGQMRETTLEQTMLGFVEGEFDVLVSTAIVESGLDIPRANTMLIDRADLFGLAQLYQLRGRVGRSELRAYCYLLVPAANEMSDEAQSRIEALERYTELGSGFRVATLDMELRGAGDLLGAEQSGVVASVGIELFCQLLEEATHELRGEEVVHDIDPELNFDVEALLPESYVEEIGLRLSLYKRLASARDEHEVTELAREMEDRFGHAPPEAVRLVELMRIKTELRRLKVLVCEASRSGVSMRLRADTPLDAGRLAALVARESRKFRLTPDGRLTRKARETEQHLGSVGLAEKMLEELSVIEG